jgi:hypothetical protein
MVEAQHTASTMKIVDNEAEQTLLENLLEGSKPVQPTLERGNGPGVHYLLATPFRYTPARGGSRFRALTDPGVFYGAGSVHTAGAELGFWRWRFLEDAIDLEKLEPVAHTAFSVAVNTQLVDSRQAPFNKDATQWQHPNDYSATQAFARAAREAGIGAIQYQSVRDPDGGWCVAVLTPNAFPKLRPHPAMQTWWLVVRKDTVIWRRDDACMAFDARQWSGAP